MKTNVSRLIVVLALFVGMVFTISSCDESKEGNTSEDFMGSDDSAFTPVVMFILALPIP